jgi:hydroxymethylbilane synthase
LAKTQSQWVANQLVGLHIDLQIIETAGDDLNISLTKPAVPGAFVNALRQELLNGNVDFIVHSFKDLPSTPHPEISIAAVPAREDHRDVLISKNNVRLTELPNGALIGTSSPRRIASIQQLNSTLRTEPIRGNVDSRIKKVRDGHYDAAILAAAGINRIGRQADIAQYFDVSEIIPAPAQGALAVECRRTDGELIKILSQLDHAQTRLTSTAERAVLQSLNAGCDLPIGAFASLKGSQLTLTAQFGFQGYVTKSIQIENLNDLQSAELLGESIAAELRT